VPLFVLQFTTAGNHRWDRGLQQLAISVIIMM